jgi:hypothetical protein
MSSRTIKEVREKVGAPLVAARMEFKKARGQWRKAVTGSDRIRVRDHVKSYEQKPSYIKFFDKLSFTLGVLNICATEYFIIHEPSKYWIWYSIVLPVMLMGRWKHFKSNKMEYFLLDFCYSVILLSLVHVHFLYGTSYSDTIFKMTFILSTGPLPAAIPLWKNSLVFHDFDKITSVYIHFLPTCLYYCLRVSRGGGISSAHLNLELVDYIHCLLFYFSWQVLYLLKTEVSDKQKLESDPALLTSMKWLSSNQKNKLSKTVLQLCRHARLFAPDENFSSTSMKTKMVFVMTQLTFTILAMIPTYHAWKYPTFHLTYIAIIFSISVFYGASYYVEVFSTRYTMALEKAAEKAIAGARQRSSSNASLPRLGSRVGSDTSLGSAAAAAADGGGGGEEGEEDDEDVGDDDEDFDDYDLEYDLDEVYEDLGADEVTDYLLVVDE